MYANALQWVFNMGNNCSKESNTGLVQRSGRAYTQLKHRGCFTGVEELTQLLGLSEQVSCL